MSCNSPCDYNWDNNFDLCLVILIVTVTVTYYLRMSELRRGREQGPDWCLVIALLRVHMRVRVHVRVMMIVIVIVIVTHHSHTSEPPTNVSENLTCVL